MNATLDIVSLVAEVLSWITFPAGVTVLIIGYLRRALSPVWSASPAVLVEVQHDVEVQHEQDGAGLRSGELDDPASSDLVLRWFASDGELHESTLDRALFSDLHPDDELTVYYDPAHPEHVRLAQPVRNGKHLVQVGWLLTVIGIVSFLLSFVVLLG